MAGPPVLHANHGRAQPPQGRALHPSGGSQMLRESSARRSGQRAVIQLGTDTTRTITDIVISGTAGALSGHPFHLLARRGHFAIPRRAYLVQDAGVRPAPAATDTRRRRGTATCSVFITTPHGSRTPRLAPTIALPETRSRLANPLRLGLPMHGEAQEQVVGSHRLRLQCKRLCAQSIATMRSGSCPA